MAASFTEAAADALGRSIAAMQREVQQAEKLRDAEFRAKLAEIDAAELRRQADFRMLMDERLASVRDGKDGERGADGLPGAQGSPGERGERGDAGEAGQQGERGLDGSQGIPGFDGMDADPEFVLDAVTDAVSRAVGAIELPAGPSGPPGAEGVPGAAGRDGADGVPGKDGERGALGIDGPQGIPGDTGPQGPSGRDGIAADMAEIEALKARIAELELARSNADDEFQRRVEASLVSSSPRNDNQAAMMRDAVVVAMREAPRPTVNVTVPVHLPKRGKEVMTVEHDANGRIKRSVKQEVD